jgi:electron transport complex protein RnfD
MSEEAQAKTPAPDQPLLRLPRSEALLVSTSPHVHEGSSVRRIMLLVILSLMPACATSLWFFGFNALKVLVLCTVACVVIEMIMGRILGRPDCWKDGSAALTGILLGMNLGSGVPWYVCVIGAVLAIALAKQLYGGLGFNPFNPALIARVGLLIGFPKLMTTWPVTTPGQFFANLGPDAVTGATPLALPRTAPEVTDAHRIAEYFFGNSGGCLGETSEAALLLGGLMLIACKIIRRQVPAGFIGTVLVFTAIVHAVNPALTPPAVFHLVSGGLFLGAFFMATDMVTSPMTRLGGLVFGIGCGLITCLIRIWGSYPEGVSFSILIMNALTPLIDRFTAHRTFGQRPPVGKK